MPNQESDPFQSPSDQQPRATSGFGEDCVANEETAALIERLSAERDEAIESRKRALADFANFQRRASESELRARDGGIILVVRNLMPVLDQMDLSLVQNASTMTVEQLLQAIGMMRSELNKALQKSGIERVEPKPGAEFDPHDHEAVMRQPLEGVGPHCIASCFQAGYRLGEMTLRPAKVSVTPD